MKYTANSQGGVEAKFEGIDEVEAVRAAFGSEVERLESLGNDSSISEYQRWVSRWASSPQTYRAPNLDQLTDPLRHFVEATEEQVDEILDSRKHDERIQAAARRYQHGYTVELILGEIDQHQNGEAVSSTD